jgi:hypothetical protein
LVLGATTAGDVLKQWLDELNPSSDDGGLGSSDADAAQQLEQLLVAITSRDGDTYLFAIRGGEFLEQSDLEWIADYAIPRIRERCPSTAFVITNSADRPFVVQGTAVTTVSMSDLSREDVADYLRRFVVEEVAVAESWTLDSYRRVQLQGQQHVLAQRR